MEPEPDISVVRPDRPGIRKVLGDLEADIMEVVWARHDGTGTTVRDVFEILHAQRRIAYTTVMNTMTRLAKKRLLRADKVDQAYIYYPTCSREDFVSGFIGRLLENLLVSFAGTPGEGRAALPDREAVARARRLLDEIERRRAAGDGG